MKNNSIVQFTVSLNIRPKYNLAKGLNFVSKGKSCEDETDLFENASSGEEDGTKTWSRLGESLEEMLKRILAFQPSEETTQKFSNFLKQLPKEWRIIQISADLSANGGNPFKSAAKDEGM